MFKGRVEFFGDGVEDSWFSVGSIAQRLEQGTHNPLVPGSNPGGPIFEVEGERRGVEGVDSPVVDRKGE